MRRMLACILVMVLLASAVPLAVTPAAAVYEKKIPCDDGDNKLTKEELAKAILPYMLDEGGVHTLDEVGDAAYVYAYWSGTPKTIVDQADRTVTFYRPVERVIPLFPQETRPVIELGATDRIVGIDLHSPRFITDIYPGVFPEGKELPVVGSYAEPNTELIVSLKPDVILTYAFGPSMDIANNLQETTGIPVVGFTWYATFDRMFEVTEIVGKVLGREKEAEELISYANEEIAKVTGVTSQINNESEKPTVFFVSRLQDGTVLTHSVYEPIDTAGGIFVTKGLGYVPQPGGTLTVSVEDFIAWDPDIILVARSGETPETSVDDILLDSRFQTMDAVENRKVYYTLSGFTFVCEDHPRVITEIFIMAKLFYPDKFNDLVLEKEGNEIFKRFYGVDGLWTELGTKCGYI
jgi:iron complex transport system substrate-binding protein